MSKKHQPRVTRRRGGRPKSTRPRTDLGTPELIAKRIALSPSDPTRGTTPLDVLKTRGPDVLSEESYSAASYFAALRKIVFGKAHPAAIDLTATTHGRLPEEFDSADAERRYRQACNYVRGQSRMAFEALESLVVHEQWPAWMFAGRGKRDTAQRHFEVGIAALTAWYRGRTRKAA